VGGAAAGDGWEEVRLGVGIWDLGAGDKMCGNPGYNEWHSGVPKGFRS
jgi:hypothetical protein